MHFFIEWLFFGPMSLPCLDHAGTLFGQGLVFGVHILDHIRAMFDLSLLPDQLELKTFSRLGQYHLRNISKVSIFGNMFGPGWNYIKTYITSKLTRAIYFLRLSLYCLLFWSISGSYLDQVRTMLGQALHLGHLEPLHIQDWLIMV